MLDIRWLALIALWLPLSAQTAVFSTSGTDGDRLGQALSLGGFDRRAAAVALGAPAHDPGAAALTGLVRVRAANGAQIAQFLGAAAGDEFGAAVALGADFDGDGRFDLAIGAPGRDAGLGLGQGQVTIISGATRTALLTIDGAAAGSRFGAALAAIGDLNADGTPDLVIGAPGASPLLAGQGQVRVHSGATGALLWSADGSTAGAALGSAIAVLPDQDADNRPDLAVAEPDAEVAAVAFTGRVLILSGATGAAITSIDGANGGDRFGAALADAGDLAANGVPVLLIGAPGFDGVAGSDCGAVFAHPVAGGASTLSLEGSIAGAAFGAAVTANADFNRDGTPDFAVGAPGFDGVAGQASGRVALYSGPSGALLFAREGTGAGDREGAVLSNAGLLSDDLRPDVLSAAPEALDGGASPRGRVTGLEFDNPSLARIDFTQTPSGPTQAVSADVDADGDADLVLIHASGLSILWNGDQTSGDGTGDFGVTPRTDLSLSAGASATSLAVGQWDADDALEIAVGRSDGTLDLFDATGSLGATAHALTLSSPVLVDSDPVPGAISGLAVLGTGALAELICAGQGALFGSSSFLARVVNPLGSLMVLGPLVSGGSFTDVVIADIDGDTNEDILAANSASGPEGGVHVLFGPAFTPSSGSPFSTGTALPLTLVALDLDGDLIQDDVAVSSIAFGAGGVRVLPNFVAGVGFGSAIDLGLSFARDVAVGNFDGQGGDDLAVLDGVGALATYAGFDGTSFPTVASIDLAGRAGVAVLTEQLTSGLSPADFSEILTVHLATAQVSVWQSYLSEARAPIAGTGFPPGASLATLSVPEAAVIGTVQNEIRLDGASPFAPVFLAVQPVFPPGSTPVVSTVSGAGIAIGAGDLRQYFGFTDLTGTARFASGLPNDPALVGIEVVLQWGILDGGPIQGTITPSDALLIRFGER